MTVESSQLRSHRRQRSFSVSHKPLICDEEDRQGQNGSLNRTLSREPTVRSASYGGHQAFEREKDQPFVRITYRDDALRQRSLDNVYRLLRAARELDPGATATENQGSSLTTSARLAQKALRYRKLLERAEQVDLDNPEFDVKEFLRITWCKIDSTELPALRR